MHRPTPTAEYLTRHALESFLDRLTRTEHKGDFILKGGILLAVYGIRRPTKDVDAEAVNASVSPEHITQVVRDVAAARVEAGLRFGLATISVQEVRDNAEYPGLRMRSTRWRDYIAIVQLAEQYDVNEEQLLQSARAVARYRKVELGPIAPVVAGYGPLSLARPSGQLGGARRTSRRSAKEALTTK